MRLSKQLVILLLVTSVAIVSADSWAQNRILASWKAEAIATSPAESVRLTDKENQTIAIVERARIVRLVEISSRLQKVAGLNADLYVVHSQDSRPNAFATTKDGRNVVGVTPTMIGLLGDDADAYAAIVGHELAHLVKQHGAERAARSGFLQGLGLIATIIIGAKTGLNLGGMFDLGVDMINKAYTRDEEREADEIGGRYLVTAGFDPQGAIRLHQKLLSASPSNVPPFLSTHPGGEERIANLRRLFASLPPSSIVARPELTKDATGPEQAKPDVVASTSRPSDVVAVTLIEKQSVPIERIYGHGLSVPSIAKGAISPSLVFLADSGWNAEVAYSGMRRALDILGQCGISTTGFEVLVIRAPTRLLDFTDANAKLLVSKLDIQRPAIFFMRDNLQATRFEVEVIASANSKTRPELRDTIWVTKNARDLGEGIARTLMYMLMDRYEKDEIPGSLFYSDYTNLDNSRISDGQCDRALDTGTKHRLLHRA